MVQKFFDKNVSNDKDEKHEKTVVIETSIASRRQLEKGSHVMEEFEPFRNMMEDDRDGRLLQ